MKREFSALLRKFRDDTSGVAAITVALLAPIFIAVLAFAVDASYWYMQKQNAQAAADSAALSVTVAAAAGASKDDLRKEALAVVKANGFTDGQNGVNVTFNTPAQSGSRAGQVGSYEVIVSTPKGLFFSEFLGATISPLMARAVTAANAPPPCLLALTGVTINGLTTLGGADCTIAIGNGTLSSPGGIGAASLIAAVLRSTGTVSQYPPAPTTVLFKAAPVVDPYSNLTLPSDPSFPSDTPFPSADQPEQLPTAAQLAALPTTAPSPATSPCQTLPTTSIPGSLNPGFATTSSGSLDSGNYCSGGASVSVSLTLNQPGNTFSTTTGSSYAMSSLWLGDNGDVNFAPNTILRTERGISFNTATDNATLTFGEGGQYTESLDSRSGDTLSSFKTVNFYPATYTGMNIMLARAQGTTVTFNRSSRGSQTIYNGLRITTDSNVTFYPGVYANSNLTVRGTTTFKPGIYYFYNSTVTFSADSMASGGSVNADGVTFVFAGSAPPPFISTFSPAPPDYSCPGVYLCISTSVVFTVNMTAPTSGHYKGVAVYADRNAAASITAVSGSLTSTFVNLNGSIYAPSMKVRAGGTGSMSPQINFTCGLLIADIITLQNFNSVNFAQSGCTWPATTSGSSGLVE